MSNARHWVQFFDEGTSLSEALASFLHDGFVQGDTLLVVATKEHWQATSRLLTAMRVPVEAAAQSGQLTVLDSVDALAMLLRSGRPDPELFDRSVGTLVRDLAGRNRTLRVYGDMVDVLASRGELGDALRLEELWNDLIAQVPLTLLCGYTAEHFADAQQADGLRRICRAHSHLRSNPRDLLASLLVQTVVLAHPAHRFD